jgi:hypothetical protein
LHNSWYPLSEQSSLEVRVFKESDVRQLWQSDHRPPRKRPLQPGRADVYGYGVSPCQKAKRKNIDGIDHQSSSSLLKILSRVTAPTSGKIRGKGRVASLFEVGTGFHPELTGRENIYLNGALLGMSRKEINRKFDEIVDFAEIAKFIDTPVKRYSSGMYVRLGELWPYRDLVILFVRRDYSPGY